ncbi:MAG: hypothetical protein ACFFEN_03770 [Candidatus Thorarchaeota archaeon]
MKIAKKAYVKTKILLVITLIYILSLTPSAKASSSLNWTINGIAICTTSNNQVFPKLLNDGEGGGIIVWRDYRNGVKSDVYAQKVNSNGSIQWEANGVAICTAINHQNVSDLVSDGTGGAIIVWDDERNLLTTGLDIYAQKVNRDGEFMWSNNGIPICTANYHQFTPKLVSDGEGGAIVTWWESDIYAQRVASNGNVLWSPNGIAICTEIDDQIEPQICSDGTGGAIIVWSDYRRTDWDIYAQRINSNGSILWAPNGTAICTLNEHIGSPQICSDGFGGVIITWKDWRDEINPNIYAQRVDPNGNMLWTLNGTAVCTAINAQNRPQICNDGNGGAFIIWEDLRNGSYYEIYAQRINSSGSPQWNVDGNAICEAISSFPYYPQICSNENGVAIIVWQDNRMTNFNIYTQQIDLTGIKRWASNGVIICSAHLDQIYPQIVNDDVGGAIFTWMDYRNFNISESDIYALRVNSTGDIPQDFGGSTPQIPSDRPTISVDYYYLFYIGFSILFLVAVLSKKFKKKI